MRLTDKIRNQIVEETLASLFSAAHKAFLARVYKEVARIHANQYKAILSKLSPKEITFCFATADRVSLRNQTIVIPERLPIVEGSRYRNYFEIDAETTVLTTALADLNACKAEMRAFESNLRAVMYACTTTKQLVELVPGLAKWDVPEHAKLQASKALVPCEILARVNTLIPTKKK